MTRRLLLAAILLWSAQAKADTIYGAWTGTAVVNGRRIPALYTFNPTHTVTRQTGQAERLVIVSGKYELVGDEMRIEWTDWLPEKAKLQNDPSFLDCIFEWESATVFTCSGQRFVRQLTKAKDY